MPGKKSLLFHCTCMCTLLQLCMYNSTNNANTDYVVCPIQCSYCWKEAQYNCCWNANYCNEVCQQAHWPEHMAVCTQVQQQQQQQPQQGIVPRTPGPGAILSPTAQPNPNGSVFMFANTSSSSSSSVSMAPQFEVAAEQTQPMRTRRRSSSSVAVIADGNYGHSVLPSSSISLEPNSSLAVAGLQPIQATVTPVAEAMPNYEVSMTTIEQIPNRNVLLNHSPSPCSPQHYRSALMDQTSCKNPTLPSINLPPSSPHSNTSSLTSIPLHAQPISPSSPPHDNPPSLQNTAGFSWPYQQPIGAIPEFPQTLPYLPQVPAATPTTQHSSFFRVF